MKKNVIYVMFSVIGIQGATYLAQLILATMLSTNEFAIVRTVEASLQLISAIAPIGISMLVVRMAAQDDVEIEKNRTLTSYLILVFVNGLGMAIICSVGIFLMREESISNKYLQSAIWVVMLSNVSRTILNYLYGRERFSLVSICSFVIALVYLFALYILVGNIGLNGWIISKYIVEVSFFILSIYFIRNRLTSFITKLNFYVHALREGSAIASSLLFRTSLDTVPLLIGSYFILDGSIVGVFGFCTLLITAATILPGSITTVLLSKYSKAKANDSTALFKMHIKYKKIVLIASIFSAIGVVLAGVFLNYLMQDKFKNAGVMLSLMSLVIPMKVMGTLDANILFVYGRAIVGTKILGVVALIEIVLLLLLVPLFGIGAVISIVLVMETLSSFALHKYAKIQFESINR